MAEFNIPGVYSKIDASAAVQSISANDKVIGIVAQATSGEDNKAYAPISFEDAKNIYGAGSNIVKLMEIAMRNGGNKFITVKAVKPTAAPDVDYKTALEALELEEAVNIVITDSTDSKVTSLVKDHCKVASENRRERIAFVGTAASADITSVKTSAETLNSGRVFLAYPNALGVDGSELDGTFTAAALAGAVSAEQDPSMPMTNVELFGFFGLAKKLKDSEMSSLIDSGIIPLEVRNGSVRIVRAISTYTKDSTAQSDITWQELTTTLISDFVARDLRARLTRKFSRSKQNKKARDAVRSEVITALRQYESQEYIENVNDNDVSIEINASNPTRNDVHYKYDVVTPMNVIHLTGHLVI